MKSLRDMVSTVQDTFGDMKWWFCYRFIPKHKYNVVKLPLPPSFYENDERLFYAIFTIFEEHVNEAKGWHGGYDYVVGDDPDFDHYLIDKEEDYIQHYEKNREIYEDFHIAWHWWNKVGKDFDNYRWSICYNKETKEYSFEKEEEVRKEQLEMMLRVVKHHRSLWC